VNRRQLEHIIRATATISEDDEIVIIGSQAILGTYPDAPSSLLTSMEADVYPKNHPELAELIEGSIGEDSIFHATFGYYADGVEEGTAILPDGWKERLVKIQNQNTLGKIGWCLEMHDIVISKYVAGRDKDLHYVRETIRHGLVDGATLLVRLAMTPLPDDRRRVVESSLRADLRGV
jgi:hypothetical protein